MFLFFIAGVEFSFAQNSSDKEYNECLKILKSSKEYKDFIGKNKVSDNDVIFERIASESNSCRIDFHLKREPNVIFEYRIDLLEKKITSKIIEDLR